MMLGVARLTPTCDPLKLAKVLIMAACSFDHGTRETEMRCLILAKDYSSLEEVFEGAGMGLFVRHRHSTLKNLLAAIPDEIIHGSAWFSFFSGLICHIDEPDRGLDYFERSVTLFREFGNKRGQLVAACQIIMLSFGHVPNPDKGKRYLADGHSLFQEIREDLPIFCRIDTARNLGWGYLLLKNDFLTGMDYCRIAESAAQELGSPGLLLEARVALGISYLYNGMVAEFTAIGEWLYSQINTVFKLLENCSVPYLRMRTSFFLSAAHAVGGELEQAQTLLTNVFSKGTIEENNLFAKDVHLHLGFHFHQALIGLLADKTDTTRFHLECALPIVQKTGYLHVAGFTSGLLEKVMSKAVELDVEREIARRLAREELHLTILDNGEVLPLLRITTLGSFKICLGDHCVGKSSDFTSSQRQLLGLLITAKDHAISREEVQLILWPKNSPDKNKANMDTLVSRLRKVMRPVVGTKNMGHYLRLHNGILSLHNCLIDIDIFEELLVKGQHHADREQWWLAGLSWTPALQLWQGEFAAPLFGVDQADRYGVMLLARLTIMAEQWVAGLIEVNRGKDAIDVLEQVLQYAPGHDGLMRLLDHAASVSKF